jgi:hypothetical protein
MKVKQTRFRPVYKEKGKTNISFAYNKPGIYVIKKKGSEKVEYVGYSHTNVAKTALRHFQTWNDRPYPGSGSPRHIVFKQPLNYLIKIFIFPPLTTVAALERLEKALINLRSPAKNVEEYSNFKPTAKDLENLKKIFDSDFFLEKELEDMENFLPF